MAHTASGYSDQPLKAGGHRSNKVSKLKDLELLEHAPDAMIAVDADGRIVFANSQTEKPFGYTSAELLGQPIELLVPDSTTTEPLLHSFSSGFDIFDLHPTCPLTCT